MVPDVTNSAASIWNIPAATFCNSAEVAQILQLKDDSEANMPPSSRTVTGTRTCCLSVRTKHSWKKGRLARGSHR